PCTHVILYFFFQAEDGIRDRNVTGVQTCALPISLRAVANPPGPGSAEPWVPWPAGVTPRAWPTAWSGRASKTKDWRSTSTTRRDEAPQGRTRDVPKVQRRAQRVKVGFSRSAVSGSLSHSSSRNKGTSVDRARRTSSVDRSRTRLGSRAAVTSAGSKWAPLA